MTRTLRGTIAAVLAAAVVLVRPPTIEAQDVTGLLARVAAYLADYEKSFSGVVSEEHYDQNTSRVIGAITSRQHRTLRSDVILTSAGDDDDSWIAFRDVFEVNAEPIRDRDQRLQKLFIEKTSETMAQAKRILDEGSRYNLGTLRRNVNVPTMALTYVRGANQRRSTFKAGSREMINGVLTESVVFTERASPTIVRSASQDMPATGRFWIDPAQGRIVKSEISIQAKASKSKITVTYAPVPKLTIWAPVTMKEDYTTSAREIISCVAQYSNFRQFAVAVTEDVNAQTYLNVAAAQMESKDYAAAEASVRRAIELDPARAAAYTALGAVLTATSKKPEAIDAWKKAVELDPRALDALFKLTTALADAGRREEARTYGERFLASAPAEQYRQEIATVKRVLGGG